MFYNEPFPVKHCILYSIDDIIIRTYLIVIGLWVCTNILVLNAKKLVDTCSFSMLCRWTDAIFGIIFQVFLKEGIQLDQIEGSTFVDFHINRLVAPTHNKIRKLPITCEFSFWSWALREHAVADGQPPNLCSVLLSSEFGPRIRSNIPNQKKVR